jgi:hypothetical protein
MSASKTAPLASQCMKIATARRFALSLPETTEEPHFEFSSFRVRGKVFATVPDGGHLHLFVGLEEAKALLHENPATFEPIGRGKRINPEWVRINLDSADTKQTRELLVEAWRAKAPRRVLADYEATTGTRHAERSG